MCKIFEIEIDEGLLEECAKEMEKIVARLKEAEQQQQGMPEPSMGEDDLRYIG